MADPNEDSLHAPNLNENSTDIRNEHIVYNCYWNKKYIIACYLSVVINSITSIILNEIGDWSVSWRGLYIVTGKRMVDETAGIFWRKLAVR